MIDIFYFITIKEVKIMCSRWSVKKIRGECELRGKCKTESSFIKKMAVESRATIKRASEMYLFERGGGGEGGGG